MRNLIDIRELKKEEIELIFKTADELYNKKTSDLNQKTLAMIFAKPSTRTRVSFETAMVQLGGHAIYLNKNDVQLGRGETIADTARVLSRYNEGIMARLFKHQDIIDLVEYSSVPVINGLTDFLHPCQALTDLFTIKQNKGLDIKLTYLGDPNNVSNSLANICNKLNIEMTIGCPEESEIEIKPKNVVHDAIEAVKEADVIYTDTWVSMGEGYSDKKINDLKSFQINDELMQKAKKDALVMHCLPAHRGQEITNSVIDGSQSIVFQQAENRLHVQKAILKLLL